MIFLSFNDDRISNGVPYCHYPTKDTHSPIANKSRQLVAIIMDNIDNNIVIDLPS